MSCWAAIHDQLGRSMVLCTPQAEQAQAVSGGAGAVLTPLPPQQEELVSSKQWRPPEHPTCTLPAPPHAPLLMCPV